MGKSRFPADKLKEGTEQLGGEINRGKVRYKPNKR